MLPAASVSLLVAGAAHAVEIRSFDVPPAPLTKAILALAAQGALSVGGDLASCGGATRSLRGRMNAEAALRRLLEDSACEAVRIDATTFRIRARPAPHASRRGPPSRLEPPTSLGEVVVTADRRRTPVNRFAGAVTVTSGAVLSLTGADDLAALAAATPGLVATNLGPGRDKFFLRGVSDGVFTGASPSTVAIYLDDLPLTYNAPDPDLRLVDVDRVEVLAGPQGALYGAGAMGGVLRVITRAPQLDHLFGELEASGSSISHGGLSRDVQGWLNAPIVPGELAVRASAYARDDAGWLDVPALNRRGANRSTRYGGRAALRWRLSDAWSVQVSAAAQALDTSDAQYVLAGAPPLVRTTPLLEPHDNDFATVSVALQGDLPIGRLKLSAARVEHRASTRYAADDGLTAFGAMPGTTPAAYDEASHRGLTFVEATAASQEGGDDSWLMGVFLASSDEKADDRLAYEGATQPLYREQRKDVFDEQAVFGEVGRRIAQGLTVRFGARLSRSTVTTTSLVSQPALAADMRAFQGEASTLRILPRVAVEYQVTARLLAYFDVADGYRPAGLNTSGPLSQTFDAQGTPPRRVRSDVARSYEVGARWIASPRLKFTSSLFYTDWLGVRSDQYTAFGLPFTVNVGDAVIDGGSLSFDWTAGYGLRLQGSAFAADPQLTQDRNLAFPSRSDAGLPGVSSAGAALDLGWVYRFAGGASLETSIRAAYVGPAAVTFDAAPTGRFGDYVTGAASAELRSGRFTLGLAIDNLLDQQADTFGFGNPFSLGRRGQLTPLRPRTVTLRIARRF